MTKFIIVPSSFSVDDKTIASGNQSAILNTVVIRNSDGLSTVEPHFQGNVRYDPMVSAMNWYGNRAMRWGFVTLDSYLIKHSLWSLNEVSDFVEENFSGVCLAQEASYGWHLHTEEMNDAKLLNDWWATRCTQTHQMVQTDAEVTYDEVNRWCNETLVGPWTIDQNYQTLIIAAKLKQDKTLIKLRWG